MDAYTTQNLFRILRNQTVMCYVSQILWDCVTQYTTNTMGKIQTWHQVYNWLHHSYTQQDTLNGLPQGQIQELSRGGAQTHPNCRDSLIVPHC